MDELFDQWSRQVYVTKGKGARISRDIYLRTADKMADAIMKGTGAVEASYEAPVNLMAAKMKHNMYIFSAAKTMHQQQAMSAALFDENGKPLTYKMFRKRVAKINPLYNDTWLKAEYDTAILQAEGTVAWEEAQRNKHIYGCLEYIKNTDRHIAFHGIKLPLDHPFWKQYYPPNGWRCNCKALSRDCGMNTTPDRVAYAAAKKAKVHPAFKHNPGEKMMMFDENEHPYFRINPKGKPQELDAVKDYGLHTPTHIRRNLKDFPLQVPPKRTIDDAWQDMVAQHGTGNGDDVILKDVAGDKILLNADPKGRSAKYTREHLQQRHADTGYLVKDVLTNPDEAWSFIEGKTGALTRSYIKYYQNKIMVAWVREENGVLRCVTSYDIKFSMGWKDTFTNLRKGMLVHANKKF